MKTEQVKHIEEKIEFLLDAFSKCHKSMKDYYYNEIKKYQLLLADLK